MIRSDDHYSKCEHCSHSTSCKLLNASKCQRFTPAINTTFNPDSRIVFVEPDKTEVFALIN